MIRAPRAKEVEYYAAHYVLTRTKFIRIKMFDGSIRQVGFSDIFHNRKLLNDAMVYLKNNKITKLLVKEFIGPFLSTKLPEDLPPEENLDALYKGFIEATKRSAEENEASPPSEIIDIRLASIYQKHKSDLQAMLREKIMITNTVLGLFDENFKSILDFMYISKTLAQTSSRTFILYCRPQETFNPASDLAEHILQHQLRQIEKNSNKTPHLATVRVTKWNRKRKQVLEHFDATMGTIEKKFNTLQQLKTILSDLQLSNAPDTSRQDVLSWMKSLKNEGAIDYAPKYIHDPLLGRFLRMAEQERNVKVFGLAKYPFGLKMHATVGQNNNGRYEKQVESLKRKIGELSETSNTAKRQQTS